MSRVRVFIACSLDGFIAGPNDELDWLPSGDADIEDTFGPFLGHIGALLMGRRTFDVATSFEAWPYGDTPVLVATTRSLPAHRPSVRSVTGTIAQMVEEATREAGSRDVYLDGGALIRSALDAALVDEITVTVVPVVLGHGLPLFAGVARPHSLELLTSRGIGAGLVQMVYRPHVLAAPVTHG